MIVIWNGVCGRRRIFLFHWSGLFFCHSTFDLIINSGLGPVILLLPGIALNERTMYRGKLSSISFLFNINNNEKTSEKAEVYDSA
jgi:hypothetical protein